MGASVLTSYRLRQPETRWTAVLVDTKRLPVTR
jgi:hypothetical protein